MENSQEPTVRFTYLKSNSFKNCHVDGFIGGITPSGFLHVATFVERPAIPKVAVHAIQDGGGLGEQKASEGRQGFVREMDCDLFMNENTARDLHAWLTDRLAEIDERNKLLSKK